VIDTLTHGGYQTRSGSQTTLKVYFILGGRLLFNWRDSTQLQIRPQQPKAGRFRRRCRLAKARVDALALVPGGGGGGDTRRVLVGVGGCRWVSVGVGGCRWVSVGVGGCRWVSAWDPSATERPNAGVLSSLRGPPHAVGFFNVFIVPIVPIVHVVLFLPPSPGMVGGL